MQSHRWRWILHLIRITFKINFSSHPFSRGVDGVIENNANYGFIEDIEIKLEFLYWSFLVAVSPRMSSLKRSLVKMRCISQSSTREAEPAWNTCILRDFYCADLLYEIVRAGWGSLESILQVAREEDHDEDGTPWALASCCLWAQGKPMPSLKGSPDCHSYWVLAHSQLNRTLITSVRSFHFVYRVIWSWVLLHHVHWPNPHSGGQDYTDKRGLFLRGCDLVLLLLWKPIKGPPRTRNFLKPFSPQTHPPECLLRFLNTRDE